MSNYFLRTSLWLCDFLLSFFFLFRFLFERAAGTSSFRLPWLPGSIDANSSWIDDADVLVVVVVGEGGVPTFSFKRKANS